MDHKNLEERLRALVTAPAEECFSAIGLFEEAADEIERLRAERDQFERAMKRLGKLLADEMKYNAGSRTQGRADAFAEALAALEPLHNSKEADQYDMPYCAGVTSAQEAIQALARAADKPRVRHIKRGMTYQVIGIGKLQSTRWPDMDGKDFFAYRSETDGALYFREPSEFENPLRFEILPPDNATKT